MQDPTSFLESLSLILLPSGEDSWPLVLLEAAAAGVPIVCFQRSGGAEEFVAQGGGAAVPYLDVEAMAQAAVRYLSEPDLMAARFPYWSSSRANGHSRRTNRKDRLGDRGDAEVPVPRGVRPGINPDFGL
jgi:glycosyltransferase involved in cell wall biosynthesis